LNPKCSLDLLCCGVKRGVKTDLFCNNLRRYLEGEPLVNVLDKRLLY